MDEGDDGEHAEDGARGGVVGAAEIVGAALGFVAAQGDGVEGVAGGLGRRGMVGGVGEVPAAGGEAGAGGSAEGGGVGEEAEGGFVGHLVGLVGICLGWKLEVMVCWRFDSMLRLFPAGLAWGRE